jgi:hypothetical protein
VTLASLSKSLKDIRISRSTNLLYLAFLSKNRKEINRLSKRLEDLGFKATWTSSQKALTVNPTKEVLNEGSA